MIFFWIFFNFGCKRGLFWIFFGFFQNTKTVLESEQAHLGGYRKGKNWFDQSFCLQKEVFWIFQFLDFFEFFWMFSKNRKLLFGNQNRHIWGVKEKEKSFWSLFLPLKNTFLDFISNFWCKSGLFWIFLDFF